MRSQASIPPLAGDDGLPSSTKNEFCGKNEDDCLVRNAEWLRKITAEDRRNNPNRAREILHEAQIALIIRPSPPVRSRQRRFPTNLRLPQKSGTPSSTSSAGRNNPRKPFSWINPLGKGTDGGETPPHRHHPWQPTAKRLRHRRPTCRLVRAVCYSATAAPPSRSHHPLLLVRSRLFGSRPKDENFQTTSRSARPKSRNRSQKTATNRPMNAGLPGASSPLHPAFGKKIEKNAIWGVSNRPPTVLAC